MKKKSRFSEYRARRPLGEMADPLLGWFDGQRWAREMPWRKMTDPYAIWLSETMLQQTQVATVVPYFLRFLARFPTVLALSKAKLETVLTMWAGLGYYRRAKHLHAAARMVVETFDGVFPSGVEELMTLPGVGRYTAGAVASIAFGIAAPVVDGNVKRVVARLTGFEGDIGVPGNQGFFWERAGEIVGKEQEASSKKQEGEVLGKSAYVDITINGLAGRYGDVNQAMMELGSTVCVPARPRCGECPVRDFCVAFAEGRQGELPVKGKKGKVPEVRGVAVVVLRGKALRHKGTEALRVLLMRRPMGGVWEGMWEFPVMLRKQEAGSKEQEAGSKKLEGEAMFRRRIEGELGGRVGELRSCGEVVHVLTHRRMVYEVVVVNGKALRHKGTEALRELPVCREGGRYEEMRWVSWEGLVRGEVGLAMARVVGKIVEVVEGFGKLAYTME